jgi:hypothetical protein
MTILTIRLYFSSLNSSAPYLYIGSRQIENKYYDASLHHLCSKFLERSVPRTLSDSCGVMIWLILPIAQTARNKSKTTEQVICPPAGCSEYYLHSASWARSGTSNKCGWNGSDTMKTRVLKSVEQGMAGHIVRLLVRQRRPR